MKRMGSWLVFGLCVLVVATWLIPPSLSWGEDLSTWDAIKKRGSIRLGVIPSEPWYYKDPSSNEWSGLGVALGKEIANEMGVKLDMVETTWGNAVAALQANQIDVLFVLDATPKRALAIDFIFTPLLYYALSVLVKEDMNVVKWADLNDSKFTVATTMGTSFDRMATALLPKANINRYPSNDETVASFQSGRSDACVMFHPALTMYQRKVGSGKIVLPQPIQYSASSAGVRREPDKTWRDFLNIAIAYYYNTGKTEELYEEFLKFRGIDPKKSPPIIREMWAK
jgi:polar amino acid transport system substrate-binding protein